MSDEDKQKDGTQDPENEKSSTGDKSQASAGSGSADGTQKPGYVTDEAYKGLQRAAEKQKQKLEQELADLRAKAEATAAELEEAKLVVNEKLQLEKSQADLNTSLQQLQAERDKLSRQINHQKIVLAEFPELAPLAAYIPPAETDEAFKTNAQAFQTAVQQYLKMTIKGNFEGGAPPINSGNGAGDATEVDKLWTEVYRLAGIQGKEKEYEEVYAKLQEALKTH